VIGRGWIVQLMAHRGRLSGCSEGERLRAEHLGRWRYLDRVSRGGCQLMVFMGACGRWVGGLDLRWIRKPSGRRVSGSRRHPYGCGRDRLLGCAAAAAAVVDDLVDEFELGEWRAVLSVGAWPASLLGWWSAMLPKGKSGDRVDLASVAGVGLGDGNGQRVRLTWFSG